MFQKIILRTIKLYQVFLSPIFFFLFSSSCRFKPTCSEYTCQAIKKYGTIKGLILGVKQLLKCHPFFPFKN